MNATKRKFNALLQGLGSSRTTLEETADAGSLPPNISPQTAAILQKRRRLGLPDSTAPVLGSSLNLNKGTFPTVQVRQPGSSPNGRGKTDVPAKYSPGDREQLIRRLATFQEITDWTPKPDKVNEIEWAKRGWICQGKETVRCLLCHKELVVKVNRKVVDGQEVPVLVPSEIEDALVDKYADLIVTSHREDCLWRKRGCDDSLLRLSLANARVSLEALRQRYDELCSRKSFLPYEFNLRLPPDLNLDTVIVSLPKDFFTNPAPLDGQKDQTPDRVALALALLGWQGLSNSRIGSVPNSASCHTCLRRLGLWMFKSKEVSESGEVLVPAPMDSLDPVREHRFFCPWANAKAQARSESRPKSEAALSGWEILLQTLSNDARLRGMYEGRPMTRQTMEVSLPSNPATPKRPTTSGAIAEATPISSSPFGTLSMATPMTPSDRDHGMDDPAEDEKERNAKDKERWARLRRVKSLFDSKGSKKLRRPMSRPGTGYSERSIGGLGKTLGEAAQ